ncbi:helix-turn-helix domain-containing protein [Streptomyces sp. NPDC003691]
MDRTEDRPDELIERHRRRERELSSLYATARSLTALRGPDEVLASVVGHAHDLIGADLAYLAVLEEDGTYLRVRSAAGALTPGFAGRMHAPAQVGIAGRVAATRAPYWESDYLASAGIVHDPGVDRAVEAEGIVSMLGVPLVAGGRFLGTLIAANRQERPFVRDDVALLSAFGDHAAVALENARLYDESRRALRALESAYATIEKAEEVHEALTRVVLAGGDTGAVADLVVAGLGGSVLVLDHARRVLAARGLPSDSEEAAVRERAVLSASPMMAAAVVRGIEESRRSGRCVTVERDGTLRHTVAAVVVGATQMGALVLSRAGTPDPVEARTLERAAQTTALLTLTQDAVVRAEERVRGELLTQLLTAPRPFAGELALRARARRVEPELLDTVLVVTATADRQAETTRLLHGLAEEYGGLAGEHLGVPVALIRAGAAAGRNGDTGRTAEAAARSVHRRLARVIGAPVLVCAAPVRPGPEPLGTDVTLANRCRRLLHGLGVRDGGTTTERLAVYAVLFDPDRDQDLGAFLDGSLGRITAHDTERGTELLGTLAAYFDHSRNLAATARALHIHINTLLKRMDRIGGLLGPDWQQPDHALRLQLAVHLHGLARRIGDGGPDGEAGGGEAPGP